MPRDRAIPLSNPIPSPPLNEMPISPDIQMLKNHPTLNPWEDPQTSVTLLVQAAPIYAFDIFAFILQAYQHRPP
jgi:hypothetical protein